MKTLKKIMAVVLSTLMVFGMVSVSVSASYDAYLDEAITDQYNSIDRVVLNENQQASLILDKLDVMLAKAEISIELPLLGTIDLTSVDEALDSIYSITGNWLFGSLTVGDLVVLETYRSDIANYRRSKEDNTDMNVILSVVSYLSKCAPTLVEMIDPSADFSWGIVKGFLPPEFRLITDDFNKWLDELLWDIIHPVNSEVMPSALTLDDIVQFLCDNQLGGENAATLGFDGLMPGFDVNIATDSGYRVIEEGIYQALNEFIVPILNSSLKSVIQDAVASNQTDGGDLHDIIDVDYVVAEYNFDRTKGLMAQINEVLGTVVNTMLKPLADRENSTDYDFVWSFEIPAGETYLDLLEANLKGVMGMIITAGGEEGFNPEGKSLKVIGDYISRIAVDEFVKHMDVPENASMEKMAYLGLRELCASVVPEAHRTEIIDGTAAQYRAEVIELAADLGAYYINNSLGLNSALDRSADQFLADFAAWCMEYVGGLFDRTAYDAAETGWGKIDAVIWEIFPKDWIPEDAMFAGEDTVLTFQSLVDYILDIIFDFSLADLNALLAHNPDSSLAGSARTLIINFVSNILNGAFTPTDAASCVPSGITTFDSIISPVSNATTIICNILKKLAADEDLQKNVLNLVVLIMGLANPQTLSDVDIDIDSRINCTSNTVSAEMRISNFSSGVNSAWRNANGVIEQDEMYEIELVSLTNTAGLTTTVAEGTIPGRKIAANGYLDIAITGTVSATTEARFDLSYYILDEDGQRIGTTPLVKSVYTHLYTQTGNYDVMSAEVTANNVTFEAFPTYLYTTNVYTAALFSILATNKSGLVTSAVDITEAIVTGTLPTGIAENAPEDGVIVAIDDSSATTATYGAVSPYISEVDPDDEQPYGIYPVEVQFVVEGTGLFGGTTTGTTEERAHTIVVYNDYNLDGVLGTVMAENRQRADYAADADAEWNAYLAAVSAGYALLDGNPDHTKMFTDVDTTLDGVQNDYYTKVEAINAAVAALDLKAITNTTKLAALTTAVDSYGTIDREDYVLFTYDRFKSAYNNAKAIVDSQTAPEGEEETFTAPAVKAFDIDFAKNQLDLWGARLINKAVTYDYINEEIAVANAKTPSAYTAASWELVQDELDLVADYKAGTAPVTQGKVNAARVNLMEALLGLEEAGATVTAYLVAVADGVIIDHAAKTISGIPNGIDIIYLWDYIIEADSDIWYLDVDIQSDVVTNGLEVYVFDSDTDEIIATYTIVI